MSGAWSVARTDVTVLGGFTQAQKAMALVESMGMRCEVMAWGFSLVSAANFQLMLAHHVRDYFEQAVPYPSYESLGLLVREVYCQLLRHRCQVGIAVINNLFS